jgi:hypothetical protein
MRRVIVLSALILCVVPPASAQYPPSQGQYVPYQGFDDPQELVEHWYQTFLRRNPARDRSTYAWAEQLRRGVSPNAVLAGIISSDEYYAKGGSNPEGFIRNLFADILVRPPKEGELRYWMRRALTQDITDPQTRQNIAYEILTSNPGSASGSYGAPPPPREGYDPERERERRREWERWRDRERERDQYDYRRPYYPYRH